MKLKNIYIIANAALGFGLSGGDRIFIELARRWSKSVHNIKIFVWEEGLEMCRRNNLQNVDYIVWHAARYKKYGFTLLYLIRTIKGCVGSLKVQCHPDNTIIYSASDFLPDSIPAMVLKLRFKDKIKWIAGFYLFAPHPLSSESPYNYGYKLKGMFYYLSQLPVYWIVKRYADMVFVTSEPDVEKFMTKKRKGNSIVVIHGGVDTKPSTAYLTSYKLTPVSQRKYDACFVGRFHYQKGILELIDIWKSVCEKKPGSRLAVIGMGPLERKVRKRIIELKLNHNIDLLGFKDADEKHEIFKQSKIMVHPATYDSGGMAAAEGMAWGLPGVSFDLEALKTYYPKGMLKVPNGNIKGFANCILALLRDSDLYTTTANDARNLIIEDWDWDNKANEILLTIKNAFYG